MDVSHVSSPALEVEALVKTYGEVEAVRGVSFTVAAGEVFGFLGPNGAGESTTINMLCTLARPTSGTARVHGFDVAVERDDVRRHIGLVFQDPTLDGHLSATQNLRLHAELYGIEPGAIPDRMDQMLEMVDLTDRRAQPVMTFSGGMKRRLEIARGLMHSPRVLFLDEPTIGLDPQTRSAIWRYIRALRESEGTTIFMTTHYMDEAEFCDRIAIMGVVAVRVPERSWRSEVRAVRAVWWRDLIRFADDRVRIGTVLVQPLLFLFVLGSGLQTLSAASTDGVSLTTFMFPGVLCMAMWFSAMISAASLVMDRELGFLREMMVAPIRRSSIVLGKCLGGMTTAMTQGVILLALAGLAHVPYDPVLLLSIFGLQLLIAFSVTALGVMVATSVKQAQTFNSVMQALV